MPKKSVDDARAKFLEALEKKKDKGVTGSGPTNDSKVGGTSGGASKRIQRKSGSA